jgi:hypothetical protein
MSALALLCVPGSVYLAAAPQTLPPRALAPTLHRPASPGKAVDGAGFLRRWLVLEPIPATGGLTDSAVRRAVSAASLPDQRTTVPRDGDTVTVDGVDLTWHAVDTTNYNVNLYHFARALNKPTSNVLFWAVTVVNVPQDMTGVRLAIGSNAASVWWVDGEEVIGIYNDRQAVIDDGVSNRLTLKRGAHVIRGAIINAGGATDFCARLLDAGDQPIRSITVELPAEGS